MKDYIFIPGNVPSSKNNKVWTGKFLVWSKNAQKYKKETKEYWEENKEVFKKLIKNKKTPLIIGFHLVRKSKHKYDFVNPVQTLQDLMVLYEYLEDDNTTIMFPVPLEIDGSYDSYDKENPGVFIKIL